MVVVCSSKTVENCLHLPFKNWKHTFFAGYLPAKLLTKNASKAQNFSWVSFNRKTVAKVSVWILCFHYFALTHFRGKSLVVSFSQKCLWRSFWRTTQKCILKKNLKHESIKTLSKTLSKTYKILKILFGFDRQAIEHTHHIWSCTITQMK